MRPVKNNDFLPPDYKFTPPGDFAEPCWTSSEIVAIVRFLVESSESEAPIFDRWTKTLDPEDLIEVARAYRRLAADLEGTVSHLESEAGWKKAVYIRNPDVQKAKGATKVFWEECVAGRYPHITSKVQFCVEAMKRRPALTNDKVIEGWTRVWGGTLPRKKRRDQTNS